MQLPRLLILYIWRFVLCFHHFCYLLILRILHIAYTIFDLNHHLIITLEGLQCNPKKQTKHREVAPSHCLIVLGWHTPLADMLEEDSIICGRKSVSSDTPGMTLQTHRQEQNSFCLCLYTMVHDIHEDINCGNIIGYAFFAELPAITMQNWDSLEAKRDIVGYNALPEHTAFLLLSPNDWIEFLYRSLVHFLKLGLSILREVKISVFLSVRNTWETSFLC